MPNKEMFRVRMKHMTTTIIVILVTYSCAQIKTLTPHKLPNVINFLMKDRYHIWLKMLYSGDIIKPYIIAQGI
ncbi:hypothetical protein [Fastidiosibacter lacustris]|uniref:hypothetical protein n=1 Tax=Fastidiosibacter lacustris TaxID=2056695 RepID=UPI000E3421C9|nr:hypothetical protein [Fastidiosibacter lacustris]